MNLAPIWRGWLRRTDSGSFVDIPLATETNELGFSPLDSFSN